MTKMLHKRRVGKKSDKHDVPDKVRPTYSTIRVKAACGSGSKVHGSENYAVSGTSRCLFSDKYKTHKYSVGRAYSC